MYYTINSMQIHYIFNALQSTNYIINQLNKSDFINQVGQILVKLRFFDEFKDIENIIIYSPIS